MKLFAAHYSEVYRTRVSISYLSEGHHNMDGMIVKDFIGEHVHSIVEQCQMGRWGHRRVRVKLLA